MQTTIVKFEDLPTLDTPRVEGEVELVRNSWGFELFIDGIRIGFIDFFPKMEGLSAQIIIDGSGDNVPAAKLVIVTPEAIDLIVNGNLIPETREHPQGFVDGEKDHVFEL
jgi:hypothetical protein